MAREATKDDDGVIGMAVPAAPVDVAVAAEEFELEDMIIIQKQTLTICTLFYYIIVKAIISTAAKRKKKLKNNSVKSKFTCDLNWKSLQ